MNDTDEIETYLDFLRAMIAQAMDPEVRESLERHLQQALIEQANGRDFEAEVRQIMLYSSTKLH